MQLCNTVNTEIVTNLLMQVVKFSIGNMAMQVFFKQTRGLHFTSDQTVIILLFLSMLYEFNNKQKRFPWRKKSEGVAISTKRNESVSNRERRHISFRIILFETAQQGPASSSIILSPSVRFHQSSVVELVEDILYIRPSRLNIHKTAPLYTHTIGFETSFVMTHSNRIWCALLPPKNASLPVFCCYGVWLLMRMMAS